MSEEITMEAAFLSGTYAMMKKTSNVDVNSAISLLFCKSYLYTYGEALTVISTLFLLDLISKPLHDKLKLALRALY